MCKNGLGLFAQKWLLFLEIWWIKFLQNSKQHLLLKFFTKIFTFDWVIAIFMFFEEWWRHVLVHLRKSTIINLYQVKRCVKIHIFLLCDWVDFFVGGKFSLNFNSFSWIWSISRKIQNFFPNTAVPG